jgi:uncharacterized protein (DUF427 family)
MESRWSYLDPYREVDGIAGLVSFGPDKVTVTLDGTSTTSSTNSLTGRWESSYPRHAA